uniref:Quinone oxidoreductase PIG3 n=1 Tax=Vitis vinifera TaxID=29760 RepID=F6HXH7_VITVI
MKAVVITTSGDPQVLQVQEVENPEIGDDEVLSRVDAAAINRTDTLQRKGLHPSSKAAVPTRVSNVCALLSGGGHAEKVAVPAGQVLPVLSGVSLKDAAGIPEVACTVWSTVLMMSRLSAGETFLVHGGSIGIGTIYSNSEILRSKGGKGWNSGTSKSFRFTCKAPYSARYRFLCSFGVESI